MGSLASCTSKDSSLKAPGYFGALVATVTYVDHTGKVRPCRAYKGFGELAFVFVASHVNCSLYFSALARAL